MQLTLVLNLINASCKILQGYNSETIELLDWDWEGFLWRAVVVGTGGCRKGPRCCKRPLSISNKVDVTQDMGPSLVAEHTGRNMAPS